MTKMWDSAIVFVIQIKEKIHLCRTDKPDKQAWRQAALFPRNAVRLHLSAQGTLFCDLPEMVANIIQQRAKGVSE